MGILRLVWGFYVAALIGMICGGLPQIYIHSWWCWLISIVMAAVGTGVALYWIDPLLGPLGRK